jgi:hypothetical protein
VALLAVGVAAGLAVLGSDDRVRVLGHAGAFLPAPFLFVGVLRCAQLALSAEVPTPRHLLRDRVLAATVAGAAAAIATGTWLQDLA